MAHRKHKSSSRRRTASGEAESGELSESEDEAPTKRVSRRKVRPGSASENDENYEYVVVQKIKKVGFFLRFGNFM